MGKALYRKYRSRKLSEIVGQEHVTTLLASALKSGRIAHAYLFTGPRGVGKTSIARILAHEINGLPYSDESTHLDIIEIDAASNNGIDDIRELREAANLVPTSASKKVYIIDEVHMLSKSAFNALLKTLEEPPEHVVFILATTDVDKLPSTIVSRTQRHNFKRASVADLIKNLTRIAKKEAIPITQPALSLIAEHSDGSFRDSVSLLDQLSSLADDGQEITPEMIEVSLGLASHDLIDQLLSATSERRIADVAALLGRARERGIQAGILATQLIAQITAHPADAPELLELVDDLIAVRLSPLPEAALLVALTKYTPGTHTARPSTTMPAAVTMPRPVSIPALEKKATEEHPKESDDRTDTASMPSPKPNSPKSKPAKSSGAQTFDWSAVVAAAKSAGGIGFQTLVAKCSASVDEDTLTVFAGSEFSKKKLSTPAYLGHLHDALTQTTGRDYEVTIVPAKQPPSSGALAHVAAIMGGGEEVDVPEGA